MPNGEVSQAPKCTYRHRGGEYLGEEVLGLSHVDGIFGKLIVEGKSKLDGKGMVGAMPLCENSNPTYPQLHVQGRVCVSQYL